MVRVWNVEDPSQPVLARTLRTTIGEGAVGAIYAGSISPDGKLLAIGGAFPDLEIRILDFKSGELLASLSGLSGIPSSISFSDDGELLLAASEAIAVWDLKPWLSGNNRKFKILKLTEHQGQIYRADFLNSGGTRRFLSVAEDKTAKLCELTSQGARVQKTFGVQESFFITFDSSYDGRCIATGSSDRKVRLWKQNGDFLATIAKKSGEGIYPPMLAFTFDSKFLVAADATNFNRGGSTVWELPSGKVVATNGGNNNTVTAIAISKRKSQQGSYLIASAGGDAHEICLWDSLSGKEYSKITGRGGSIFACAFNAEGNEFACGQTNGQSNDLNYDHPLVHSFDLETFSLGEPTANTWTVWNRRLDATAGLVAERDQNNESLLYIYRNGSLLSTIQQYSPQRNLCYTFTKDGKYIIVGSDFFLTMFDVQTGGFVKNFAGHTGSIWAVSLSPDGKTLLSASGDQIVRMWDIYADADKDQNVSSFLNFFIARDGRDWIAWSNAGYYTGSPGADEMLGWHLNGSVEETPTFAAAWQYSQTFRRPEVVRNIFKTRSVEKALALVAKEQNNSKIDRKIDIATDRDQLAVPTVQINSPTDGDRTNRASVPLNGLARSVGAEPIKDVRILVNGRPATSNTKGFSVNERVQKANNQNDEVPFSLEIQLVPGRNSIEVVARTQFASSVPAKVEVIRESQAVTKPTLYVLGIGVSKYADSELDLSFPGEDIRVLAKTLQAQGGGFYASVVTDLLIDSDVTDRNIKRAMTNLRRNVTQNDVAIVIVSGHGDIDNGEYFFCPHDHDPTETSVYGIRFSTFTQPLADLPCKVVLCMDTCHAAGVLGPSTQRTKSTSLAINDAVAELTSISSGVVVMTSSTGKEESLEDDVWGHGAFALALIEAFSGRHSPSVPSAITLPCDLNNDSILEISEIDAYVTARVKELTGGRQHPVTERGRIPSFPLATVE